MKQLMKQLLIIISGLVGRILPAKLVEWLVWCLLFSRTSMERPDKALQMLLSVDNRIYILTGRHAVRYGQGSHVKHRLTGYIKYFATRAAESPGPYLDVGCSKGEIASLLATMTEDKVVGVDINKLAIDEANRLHRAPNLSFIHADATGGTLSGQFGTIILSNVLEHIEHRTSFLLNLQKAHQPERMLIRVPQLERDWRVALKRELDVDYRLDPTHWIEYTLDDIEVELETANLIIIEIESRWGEFWIVSGVNRALEGAISK